MFPRPIQETHPITQKLYYLALLLSILVWLMPLAAIMLTSFRSLEDINQGNYWGIPSEILLWENYFQVFMTTPLFRYLINTTIISVIASFFVVLLSSFGGFALAKYNFRGSTFFFLLFIAGNFVPFQILMIPVRDLTIRFNLYDTYAGLILFHIAFQTGFAILFMRNFIFTVPNELMEAARVDGAKEWQIFLRVIVPVIRPALAAVSVLIFTFVWNDFFWALVLVQSDEVRPITAGLSALKGQWIASWQLLSAGSIVAALPPVLMFFFMQKHFIAGLTLGANKG